MIELPLPLIVDDVIIWVEVMVISCPLIGVAVIKFPLTSRLLSPIYILHFL